VQHAVYLPPAGTFGDVHALVELAALAERSGWDGVFLWDHVLCDGALPVVDTWTALTAIATTTSRIRLGPLVTGLARRRPWKVARESVTLDHLSGGRLVLGVGLGIDYWREFSAFPTEASDDGERAALLDDGIEILTRLWSGEPVTYRGRRLSVDDACFLPRPVQHPRIPLWSAALWPPSRPGPIRRAARCDGVMPFKPEPITPGEAAEVRALVAAERVTNAPFDVCVWGAPGLAADYEAAGVTWLIDAFHTQDTPIEDAERAIARGPQTANT
jgi:alkanesulfonate monooxygenase SsuD/methylene tetrahydromethanopterin reductase-like flavin-dependent oxidoreductase (luciferase family)